MSTSQDRPPPTETATEAEARAAGDAVEKTATEASGGTKTGHVRWMLVVGLVLVVIALGAAWLSYASRPRSEEGAAASRPAPAATQTPAGAG